jgi:hypothetical protein
MIEIKTAAGAEYIIMGQRALKNGRCLTNLNCPTVIWVGCIDSNKKLHRSPILGKTLCIRFRSGLYVGDKIVRITERDG